MEEDETELIWDDLKKHISPPEVPIYARKIGLARISRNKEIYNELKTLRKIQNSVQSKIVEEIEKKTPAILVSPQRTKAIQKCINFLNSLKEQGHFIETDNPMDQEIIKYLKLTKLERPNSTSQSTSILSRPNSSLRSTRSAPGLEKNIEEVQELLDEEFENIQMQIQQLRCDMFAECDQLSEAKAIETPTTDSIEQFNRRLQQQDFTLRNMASMSSSQNRLKQSIKMNRLWE